MSIVYFATGDRVIVSTIDGALRVGTIAGVTRQWQQGRGHLYDVDFDDGSKIGSKGISQFSITHANLEKINMSDTLKRGDRVRYTGITSDYIGLVGEVVVTSNNDDVPVRWDGKLNNSYVMKTNLEKIVKIDTTKSLELASGHDTKEVTFVTLTSEGHILVSMKPGSTGIGSGGSWYMFDTNGKFVRSETGNGFALTLRNKAPQPVVQNGNVVIPGFGTTLLQLTSLDGVLTDVKLA